MKTQKQFFIRNLVLTISIMIISFLSKTVANNIEKSQWTNHKKICDKHNMVLLEYEAYLGKYDMGEGITFTLTQKDQRLIGELSGVGTIEIFPEEGTADTFYAKMAPAKFVFQRDKDDKVNSLTITIEAKGTLRGQKVQ